MSNSNLLRAGLHMLPDDDGLICALLDALREDESLTLAQAVDEVARIRRDVFDGRELSEAAALLAEGSEWRDSIHENIFEELNLHSGSVLIALVNGPSGPRETARSFRDGVLTPITDITITVGAGWVVNEVFEMRDKARRDKYDLYESAGR